MKTLLQVAKEVKTNRTYHDINAEEEKLALAWLDKSINYTQFCVAIKKKGGNSYARIGMFLRSAYESGKLKIV